MRKRRVFSGGFQENLSAFNAKHLAAFTGIAELLMSVSVCAHTWKKCKESVGGKCRIVVRPEDKERDTFMLRVLSGTVTQKVRKWPTMVNFSNDPLLE